MQGQPAIRLRRRVDFIGLVQGFKAFFEGFFRFGVTADTHQCATQFVVVNGQFPRVAMAPLEGLLEQTLARRDFTVEVKLALPIFRLVILFGAVQFCDVILALARP
jgi:hypothetical protein